jgi:plastocyanin
MARAAIIAGTVALLVVIAAAVWASAVPRVHRLHVPPPPLQASDDPQVPVSEPAAPDTRAAPPPGTSPPPPPLPAPPPPPPPPPPGAIGCTRTGDATPADLTGRLLDYDLELSPASLAAAPALRVRGVNQGSDTHTLAIRPLGGARLCATANITTGLAAAFELTNVPPGTYQLFCTLHPASMQANFTVG